MSHSRKNEKAVLADNEVSLVEQTRHPALGEMDHAGLMSLIHNLRDKRDRAQTIANNQRRALRGKGGRGQTEFEKADLGNRQKASVLNDALTRARRELTRREAEDARTELMENAQRALAMKQAAGGTSRPDGGPTANKGMSAKARKLPPKIGAASEAGRVTKAVAVAQAKKDSRRG